MLRRERKPSLSDPNSPRHTHSSSILVPIESISRKKVLMHVLLMYVHCIACGGSRPFP